MRLLFSILFCGSIGIAHAQTCTANGQTPETAVLVCGSATFTVNAPGSCGLSSIPVPCGGSFAYRNTNPHFYRMACYSAGTLGFTITPSDPNADYNWQLFDITNTNPADIFTSSSLFVACNWSSDLGPTGASIDGTQLAVCGGSPQPLFSQMPDIVRGRTYLLMVSNASNSPASYQLAFDGGSASITDAVEPHLLSAGLNCNGTMIWVRLNKPVMCSSVSGDGSEFSVSGGANIIGTSPGNCDSPLGSDSMYLLLDRTIPNGNYTLTIHNGSDGNTLNDICFRFIPDAENIPFTVGSPQPTPMDSIKPGGCTPGYIELVFKKPMRCNSFAADGSDFIISGPQPLAVSPACTDPKSSVIRLYFTSTPPGGNYQLKLVKGSDGNTIIDDCGLETTAGAVVDFVIKEYVSAQFTYDMPPSCKETTISFFHDGAHNVNNWSWDFGNGMTSAMQNPVQVFTQPGTRKIRLTVTNGVCTDTASQIVSIGAFLNADFELSTMACPGDTVSMKNFSTGNIDAWRWDFGDGFSSDLRDPPAHRFAFLGRDVYYTIRLSTRNSAMNCGDTISHVIKVLGNCYIAVPSAFTPNGDGLNDYLYPLNALKADDLQFRVYNRLGELIFTTREWTRKWDGTRHGLPLPTGVYAWLLSYTDHDSKQKIFLKGTTLLIR